MMPSYKNKIVIAAAGGRKTSSLVEDALAQKNKKILITTYTNENLDQLKSYIVKLNGFIPHNITVLSWFTFLLRDCVRPYQNHILKNKLIKSIDFQTKPVVYLKKTDESYYINSINYIYKDRVSDFIYQCNVASKGLIVKRLEKIYHSIYIDEMQDLSGWDQDFVELLLLSSIPITMVGDPRQATYTTNTSQKNKAKKGKDMLKWVKEISKNYKNNVQIRTECFRSNQKICDFADELYPHFPKTISKNTKVTGHDGIFTINQSCVNDYIKKHKPKILRWNIKSFTMNYPAINIGVSKGRTYDRVLIFPTKPMKIYLKTKDIKKAGDISKLYVAITRARFSVAFVLWS